MRQDRRSARVCARTARLPRLADDFDKVGTHLGHAQSKYHEADKRLGKFGTKLKRAVEEQEELEGETVLELPGVAADAA